MNRWCQINFYVQLSIIALALLSTPFSYFFGPAILLIPFGGWQVISSIVFAVQHQKIEKRNLILFKIYWIILGLLALWYLISYTEMLHILNFEMIGFGISIILGIFYFIISIRMTRNRTVRKTSFLPNILDQF